MVMTIDIPEKALAEARARGIDVEVLIREKFETAEPLPPGFTRLGTPKMNRDQATATIREIASRTTLGDLNIKDLIEDGRR
jgi:hypothetical protein